MNSLVIIIISLILFFLGYRFYAKKLENLWQINSSNPTPAVTKYDGVDFVPAKNWLVLFGHHFASIAGAGPIIGPVIACIYWGWMPALLWVILGTIFIGGTHDFAALITSVREGGRSISDIAADSISKKAKLVFSWFVWLALILVNAVFTYLCAKTFVDEPKIILPSLGLIPVAMLVGFLLYNLKARLVPVTILGLVILAGLFFLGNIITIPRININIWIFILLIYCFLASVMPVNILLQPRDYLSSFLLFFGVACGILGLFITHPKVNTQSFVALNTSQGFIWPMLFVTVACGAVSGFHALISSGTTSKQLANERYTKRVGYGAMVTEGVVAVLAILAISCGFKNQSEAAASFIQLGPIGVFGKGYAKITDVFLVGLGGFIAIAILNAFILTTLDTATRISRYISEELFLIKNRFLSTFIIVVLSGALALSGKWQKIWPVFGASNQLVAALALLVISCWLLSRNKTLRYTLIPAFFMLITTIGALVYQIVGYLRNKDYLLFFIAVVLVGLAIFITKEFFKIARSKLCKAG